MFKKILFRSLAGATAVGSALAISLVTTPGVVTSAPEIRPVACGSYAPGAVTKTTVSARPSIGAYGTSASAIAKVQASGGGATPRGHVTFVLYKPGPDRVWHDVPVYSGTASVTLPRDLPAEHTYTIRATYDPSNCNRWIDSADTGYYTVVKAQTTTRVNAPDVRRGDHARVNVRVSSSTLTPGGSVRIVVKRRSDGKVIASATRALRKGQVSARFGRYPVGTYRAKADYLGSSSFGRSSDIDDFRVRR